MNLKKLIAIYKAGLQDSIGHEDGMLTCYDEKVSYLLTMIKAAPLHV